MLLKNLFKFKECLKSITENWGRGNHILALTIRSHQQKQNICFHDVAQYREERRGVGIRKVRKEEAHKTFLCKICRLPISQFYEIPRFFPVFQVVWQS